MAALVEGLAGVRNEGLAFDKVKLSPRWTSAGVDSVNVTIQFAASKGYVAYRYINNHAKKEMEILITGSGRELAGHILFPKNIADIELVTVDSKPLPFSVSKIESSRYLDFNLKLPEVQKIIIKYR
jgi:hypothetical protein